MAGFLSTPAIVAEMRRIVDEAKSEVIMVSPLFKLSDALFTHVKKARKRGVAITIVYDRANFTDAQLRWLAKADDLSLYHNRHLHANCYCNEDRMVITSMHVQEYGPRHFHEMGVLVRKERDKELYKKAISEVQSILEASTLLNREKGDFKKVNSFFLQELGMDLAQVKNDLQSSIAFLQDDLQRTMGDMKSTLAFLRNDYEKTRQDLTREISLGNMKGWLRRDMERTIEDLTKEITVLPKGKREEADA